MSEHTTSAEQLGFILRPKNLLKTLGSQFGASTGVEILNQLEGLETGKRLETLEERVRLAAMIGALEKRSPPSALMHDWSIPASEYYRRTVDVAVAYRSRDASGVLESDERILPVSHACITNSGEITICEEAAVIATKVAEIKGGRVVFLAGMACYECNIDLFRVDQGLRICDKLKRNEEMWDTFQQLLRDVGSDEIEDPVDMRSVRFSASFLAGQEIGFVHSGEVDEDEVMCGFEANTARQFDTATISHFRKPTTDALKIGVSGVLGGRIVRQGAPVFNRVGELLGFIVEVESLPSDAGRRAVVRSLLGHPRFTKSLNSTKSADEQLHLSAPSP